MDSPPLVPVSENPAAVPAAPAPPAAPRRSAQLALGFILVALAGLLLFRGYGNRLGLRPTESVSPRPGLQLDLNTTERAELEQLPGLGPKLALAIDDHRRTRGPFRSVDDLKTVHGIGDKTLDKIRPFLQVKSVPEAEPAEPLVLTRKAAAPAPPPAGAPTWTRAGAAKIGPGEPPINVNTASVEDLQRLPGIGPTLAQRIVERRAATPFKSVDDLRAVKGIGVKILDGMRPFVTVR